ncbi:MAG: hypothetical protein ACYCYP_13880 [Leptospirales bacterium]
MPIPVPSASPRAASAGSREKVISLALFCTAFQIVILSSVHPKVDTIFAAIR